MHLPQLRFRYDTRHGACVFAALSFVVICVLDTRIFSILNLKRRKGVPHAVLAGKYTYRPLLSLPRSLLTF